MTTSSESSPKSESNPIDAGVEARRPSVIGRIWRGFLQQIDSDYFPEGVEAARNAPERMEWARVVPFAILHLGCLGVIWTGWSWTAVAVAVGLYVVRMFAVTGIYHRYFCHRAYRMSRPVQFVFALIGLTAVQRGPLWWAAVHRHHHMHSDEETDAHSPHVKGFWWSHVGWLTSSRNFPTDYNLVRDFSRYPELVFLNRFDLVGPLLLVAALAGLGAGLNFFAPQLGTGAGQMVVWGFFISTVFLFHATCSINSVAHVLGSKRYETEDESRNSFLLAIVTLGEGWHNNHHRYQGSARQGFYWWEIDVTYYILRALGAVGIIRELRPVPESAYTEARRVESAK